MTDAPSRSVVTYFYRGDFRATRHVEGCPTLDRARMEFDGRRLTPRYVDALHIYPEKALAYLVIPEGRLKDHGCLDDRA